MTQVSSIIIIIIFFHIFSTYNQFNSYILVSFKLVTIIFILPTVGMKGPDKDIGSWAIPKDVKEPKDKQVLGKTSKLLGRGKSLVIINR